MSSRSTVQMSPSEVEEFLGSRMKVQVATVGADGAPHLTTLFYVVEHGGRLAFWTYAASQKVVNLRRDPRITCLVEDGDEYFELRGVSIAGTAHLLQDYEDVRTLGARVTRRMTDGVDLGDAGEQLLDQQARKRVGIVVEPARVASWDHGKLTGPPGDGALKLEE